MNNTTITVLVGLLFYLLNRNTTAATAAQPITTPAKSSTGSGVSLGSAAGTAANAAVSSLFGSPAITAGLTNALDTTNDASYGLTTTQTIDQNTLAYVDPGTAPTTSVVYDPTQDASLGSDDPSSDSDFGD